MINNIINVAPQTTEVIKSLKTFAGVWKIANVLPRHLERRITLSGIIIHINLISRVILLREGIYFDKVLAALDSVSEVIHV